MPKLTIDGREIEAPAGTSVIKAARDHGIEIPHYCWHPKLSVPANCRMCLVEVEKAPKLTPACEAQVRDGMVVHTQSPKVLEARAAVQEFLLINHPIDCPICDQAGECKLQDYYMQHDKTGTRFDEIKVPKKKAVVLGPTVILDEERCINCTRCVRFMDEVAHNPQLGQFERGDRAMIGTFPGQPLDDPYSANVADVCPVGALTYRDFRFKVRSWFLKHADSVCPGCARGCSTRIDHHDNAIARLKPRENDFINNGWLCDDGRVTYKRVHDAGTQITEPHAREGDRWVPIGWDRARQLVAEILGPYLGDGDGSLGLALSSQVTTEGATAFIELAEELLQVDTYAIIGMADWKADRILKVADQNPNRAGLELVLEAYSIFDEGPEGLLKAIQNGTVKTLIALGTDYPASTPEWIEALRKIKLIAFASNWDDTGRAASLVIPLASYAEQDGTFVNIQGRLQRVSRALTPIKGRKPAVEAAAFVATALGAGGSWEITNWLTAFNRLKRHTNLLQNVSPTAIGPWGVLLEASAPEGEEAAASAAVAG
ncbi:MAG: (2Fe-2S)-binding protein [Deltaproteobacteria bacterium]|nr:(2Fe-2S)-binding protein [Deltaproteobacteria bacterium]